MSDTMTRCEGVHVDLRGGGWLCDAPTDGARYCSEHEGGVETHDRAPATEPSAEGNQRGELG